MERKVGEIFEYNGEWYQCVEGAGCYQCAFNRDENTCTADSPYCTCRSDKKDVVFKKLEKVGEPYSIYCPPTNTIILLQRYRTYEIPIFNDTNTIYYTTGGLLFIDIELKQTKEDMKENNDGNTPLNELTDRYVNGSINYDEFEKEVKALYSCKKEVTPKLIPFDFEAVKAGKPVCTRDGRQAKIIYLDAKGSRPIVALVKECDDEEETPYKYHCDGSYNCQSIPSDYDLMLLPEKKEGWVNVYKRNNEHIRENECNISTGIGVYESESEAKRNIDENGIYVDTIKITWGE